ncbi:polysaccharide lyase family 7 protein [Marinifilum caeruleilacunae]|uniref:Polysaccharide lyase family 7 protein n=1 Tax=Marinifilum caeruleilacunae TaxID=2499076 RepID=A0ABX1WUH1_9BACT|nr:polysaccharide lyase family 7 protein [Marinifilum caeruleilacunae]NOU59727.1 polysaccharide lyase family 7 protein [Marinifilum caeruleilacunae]
MLKSVKQIISIVLSLFLTITIISCQGSSDDPSDEIPEIITPEEKEDDFKLPDIDLSNWKVTLPIGNPSEVLPPEILNYANNESLKPFMYNDSIEGALVFYTYPEASTANSSYSRTELRELMNPEDKGKTNWTFAQGGYMKGTLAMGGISKDENDKYHRVIIMQIHGRLTDEQRDLIGAKDNNAPPMLKIYWTNGEVRVKTKVLKNLNDSYEELLETDAWGDDEGYTFSEAVGFGKFTLEVKVSDGRMEVILNDKESVVYDDIHIEKWGVFENYFKAGNYLISLDENAYSTVKYFDLEVSH